MKSNVSNFSAPKQKIEGIINLASEKKATTAVVDALNQLLANYNIYKQNLQTFSWHTTAETPLDLKEKLSEYHRDSQLKIEALVKRICALEHRPKVKLSSYINLSEIKEVSGKLTEKEMAINMLESQKILVKCLQETLNAAASNKDIKTVDMVTRFMKDIENLID